MNQELERVNNGGDDETEEEEEDNNEDVQLERDEEEDAAAEGEFEDLNAMIGIDMDQYAQDEKDEQFALGFGGLRDADDELSTGEGDMDDHLVYGRLSE